MKCNHGASAITLVGILATLGILGCGGGRSERVATQSSPEPKAPTETFAAVAQAADQGPETGGSPGQEAVSTDSLPPDVVALAADTVAAPGATVEIAARASADAVEVSLWDGLGRRQLFAYDSTTNNWRARYRVPLASAGRIGLSVTAKNGLGLRHRVWVFVRVEREGQAGMEEKQSETGPAPSSGS